MNTTLYTYKNISDQPQTVINHGVVEAGKRITSETPIENPLFELVKEEEQKESTNKDK